MIEQREPFTFYAVFGHPLSGFEAEGFDDEEEAVAKLREEAATVSIVLQLHLDGTASATGLDDYD